MAGGDETLSAATETGPSVERIASAPESDTEIIDDITLPEIMLNHVEEHGDEVALRWKRYGVWEEFDWDDYYDRVQYITLGLESLGFGHDDVLFTIGYNRPHQLWAWLGAQTLGGMAAPNYEDMLPDAIGNQLELLDPKVAYAEDQEKIGRAHV